MANPKLAIDVFKIKTKKAVVNIRHIANVYAENGNPAMADILADHIQNMADHDQKGYLTFTTYKRNHQKADVETCSAIMLEYPYRDREALVTALAAMPYAHYLIDTQSDFDANAEARILVAFPLLHAITEPKTYTRVASLLWDEIGVEAHTKGDISSTFLFAPYTINPKVVFHDNEILDADTYLESRRGEWVVATAGEHKSKPKQVSDDGLWVGL